MLPGARMLFGGGAADEGGTKVVTLPYLLFNVNGKRNGSRYFNSGIVPGASTKVEFLMGRNDAYVNDFGGWQSGCRTGWVSNALMLNYGPKIGRCWIVYDNGTYGMNEYPADPSFGAVLVTFDALGNMSVGSSELSTGQPLSLAGNAFYIGDVNENGTPKGGTDSQGSAKMYWCKIYEGGVLVKHYVPDRQNGEAVLHELVSDSYLSSEGSFAASSIAYGEETITLVDGGKIEMKAW